MERNTEPQDSGGLTEQLSETVATGRRVAADFVELVGLDARLAGISAAKLLGYALLAAFMLVTAWLMLLGALITWLNMLGLNLGLAFLLFACVNIVVAAGIGYLALRCSHDLTFASTRRALTGNADHEHSEGAVEAERA